MDPLEKEALTFARYLIGRDATPRMTQIYKAAMSDSRPSRADKKLLAFMVAHPHSIGFIDGGLVFHNPMSEARRRLYVMFAILEASPEYYDMFLPKKRSFWYITIFCLSGIRAIARAVVGLPLVKMIR